MAGWMTGLWVEVEGRWATAYSMSEGGDMEVEIAELSYDRVE